MNAASLASGRSAIGAGDEPARNTYSNCKLRKSDGKALPNRLDRCSMPFFKPPANTLDPFQLELCADAFKQTWFEIAGDCRLPPFQEERLQTEVSAKLCFFAAKGVVDPGGLLAC